MINEEIKPILNDERKQTGYFISNIGKVYSTKVSKKLRERKQSVDRDGYKTIVLYIDGKYKFCRVNRLVAIYFIPNPKKLPEVNHINGDKLCNEVTNLEWVSRQENMDHAWRTGLANSGEKSNNHKLTENDVHKICRLLEEGYKYKYIRDKIGDPCTIGMIKNIAYKKSWTTISDNYDLSNIRKEVSRKKENKLKISQVLTICKLLEKGMGVTDISKIIGCTRNQVVNIKFRSTWKDVSKKFNF